MLVSCEACVQFGPQPVEYDWIFDNLATEEPLGEAGHEDRVERHPPGSFHRPNKNCSITLSRRRNADLQEKVRNHVQQVAQRDWPDGRHRQDFGEHRQDPLRLAQRPRCERPQVLEPIAPGGGLRQCIQGFDDASPTLFVRVCLRFKLLSHL